MKGYKGPPDRFGTMEAVKGESFDGEVLVRQHDGVTPVDLRGSSVSFYLWADPDEEPILEATEENSMVLMDEPEEGSIKLNFPIDVMGSLNTVAYLFQLWTDNGYGVRKMEIWGYFWVKGGMEP